MRKQATVFLFILLLSSVAQAITFPHTQHWTTFSPWGGPFYGSAEIDTTTSAPGSPSSSLKYIYAPNYQDANSPDTLEAQFEPALTEFWIRYWFKYSSNWTHHSVTDKQMYFYIGNWNINDGNFFIGVGKEANYFYVEYQPRDGGSGYRQTNTGNPLPPLTFGEWHRVTAYFKLNTAGVANGIARVWISNDGVNDVLVLDHNDIPYREPDQGSATIGFTKIAPVWGGNTGETKPNQYEYFYVDYLQLQTNSFTGQETNPPSVVPISPTSGQTNWPISSQNLNFDVTDETAVDSSTLSFWVTGFAPRSCASGLTCTPSGDPTNLDVVYSQGANWEYNTTYTANADVYDTLGNRQQTNWQFTTEASIPDTNLPTIVAGSQSPTSGQTNWPVTNRTISFDVSDDVAINDASLLFRLNNFPNHPCGDAFVTCSWVAAPKILHVVYTRDQDHEYSTLFTANLAQVDDTTGNRLTTSWTFTTEGAPQPPKPPTDIEIHVESP